MFERIKAFGALFVLASFVVLEGVCGAIAQDAAWHVGKSSGDVWLTAASGVKQVSLGSDATLKPGDNIRTGRTGRVLLVRGEETILISPNSAIGIPTEATEGLSTTIIEQAGSILLDVEKRNVKHFEVETPLPRRRRERHPFPRLRQPERRQRRGASGPSGGGGFQVRPDRAGHARPPRFWYEVRAACR